MSSRSVRQAVIVLAMCLLGPANAENAVSVEPSALRKRMPQAFVVMDTLLAKHATDSELWESCEVKEWETKLAASFRLVRGGRLLRQGQDVANRATLHLTEKEDEKKAAEALMREVVSISAPRDRDCTGFGQECYSWYRDSSTGPSTIRFRQGRLVFTVVAPSRDAVEVLARLALDAVETERVSRQQTKDQ